MPNRASFGLLDSVIVVCSSAALVVFIFWLGGAVSGKPLLENLPEWLNTASSKVWGWLTASGAGGAALALRKRLNQTSPTPNYLGYTGGVTALLIAAVFAVTKMFPQTAYPPSQLDPSTFALKFQVQFPALPSKAELSYPTLIFLQQEPRPLNRQRISAAGPDHIYEARVDLPPANSYLAATTVPEYSANATDIQRYYISPSWDLCLHRRMPDPVQQDKAHYYGVLRCTAGSHCELGQADPGWITNCDQQPTPKAFLPLTIPVVHAQTNPATHPPELSWLAPSVETLERLRSQGTSYTDFTIQIEVPSKPPPVDYFTYQVKANAQIMLIDGLRGQNVRIPVHSSADETIHFGLENLDFSGAGAGCEDLEVEIAVHQEGGATKTYKIFRGYVAMRNASPMTISSPDGAKFTWIGTYKPASDEWEVLIASPPDATAAAGLKTVLDSAALRFKGAPIRGKVRPPLSTAAYGIALGLQQLNGQIHFAMSKPRAQELKDWWTNTVQSISPLKRRFGASPFLYIIPRNGRDNQRVCSASGLRS